MEVLPESMEVEPPQFTQQRIVYYTKPTEQNLASANQLIALANHPQLSEEITSRINQVFAEFSLSGIQGQFPIKDILVPGAIPTGNVFQPLTIEDKTIFIINTLISESNQEGVLPIQSLSDNYLELRSNPLTKFNEFEEPVITEAFKTGENGSIFDITKEISTGTTQGTVYGVTIHPSSSVHTVDVINQRFGLQKGVTAVMKKSPIINPVSEWINFVAKVKLFNLIYNVPPSPDTTSQISLILKQTPIPISTWQSKGQVEIELRNEYNATLAQINNPNALAYTDVIGNFLGSQFVEHGLSPAFALEYAAFRAFDTSYFDPVAYAYLMPEINQGFLVQLSIQEQLGGTLHSLYESGFFKDPNNPLGLDIEKSWSLFAQVIFALALAQRSFGLVHNDLHSGNILYSNVDQDHYLYYKRRLPSGKTVYYRVPTDGKVFKIIDFGLSTFDRVTGGQIIGSNAVSEAFHGNWNPYNRNNDLYEFTSYFVFNHQSLMNKLLIGGVVGGNRKNQKFLELITYILSCGTGNAKTNIVELFNLCKKGQNAFDPKIIENIKIDNNIALTDNINRYVFTTACQTYMFKHHAYTIDSSCNNAVPEYNLDKFGDFYVSEKNIPKDAIVYLI